MEARHGSEPLLWRDLLLCTAAAPFVEERFARHLLNAWSVGCPSLVPPGIDFGVPAPRPDENLPDLSRSCSSSGYGLRAWGL